MYFYKKNLCGFSCEQSNFLLPYYWSKTITFHTPSFRSNLTSLLNHSFDSTWIFTSSMSERKKNCWIHDTLALYWSAFSRIKIIQIWHDPKDTLDLTFATVGFDANPDSGCQTLLGFNLLLCKLEQRQWSTRPWQWRLRASITSRTSNLSSLILRLWWNWPPGIVIFA